MTEPEGGSTGHSKRESDFDRDRLGLRDGVPVYQLRAETAINRPT